MLRFQVFGLLLVALACHSALAYSRLLMSRGKARFHWIIFRDHCCQDGFSSLDGYKNRHMNLDPGKEVAIASERALNVCMCPLCSPFTSNVHTFFFLHWQYNSVLPVAAQKERVQHCCS